MCAQRVHGRRDTAGHERARRDTNRGLTWDFGTLAGTRRHPGARCDGFTRRIAVAMIGPAGLMRRGRDLGFHRSIDHPGCR